MGDKWFKKKKKEEKVIQGCEDSCSFIVFKKQTKSNPIQVTSKNNYMSNYMFCIQSQILQAKKDQG